ncbi:hypothetical protein C8F04DRAFT_1191837 [Mycena alexandri]|uniref:Uncharacterized protein n=1 Tax=Mycena alexandri TaxID=1745969 RepID=A0AAD6SBZ1_9AGAR|nr:hypothetical protein C8F04DRAFT_1191837 [Mycena alexandri]
MPNIAALNLGTGSASSATSASNAWSASSATSSVLSLSPSVASLSLTSITTTTDTARALRPTDGGSGTGGMARYFAIWGSRVVYTDRDEAKAAFLASEADGLKPRLGFTRGKNPYPSEVYPYLTSETLEIPSKQNSLKEFDHQIHSEHCVLCICSSTLEMNLFQKMRSQGVKGCTSRYLSTLGGWERFGQSRVSEDNYMSTDQEMEDTITPLPLREATPLPLRGAGIENPGPTINVVAPGRETTGTPDTSTAAGSMVVPGGVRVDQAPGTAPPPVIDPPVPDCKGLLNL